jgi:hypothetical protein
MQQRNKNEVQESLFICIFQQQNIMTDENRINNLSPLYILTKVTRRYTVYVVRCLLPVRLASYQHTGKTYTGQVRNIQYKLTSPVIFRWHYTFYISSLQTVQTVYAATKQQLPFFSHPSQSFHTSWYYQSFFFIYQLMHKRIALKRILKFKLKQLRHVSV